MRAVDTNVLARYYLRDDPTQARLAGKILSAGGVFVPKTVILELEWVLRSVAEQPGSKVTVLWDGPRMVWQVLAARVTLAWERPPR